MDARVGLGDAVKATAMGESAILIDCSDARMAAAVADRARSEFAAIDVVPGASTVLVDGVAVQTALARVRAWDEPEPGAIASGPVVELTVRYDGPDLSDVAALWGMSVEAAVAFHQSIEFVSAFCGFVPGFAYCAGLPSDLAVPRLETPRSRVPAGSVAVADVWTGVYPRESPGGWRLLGVTGADLWRTDREQPALLAPGTRVRFVAAS